MSNSRELRRALGHFATGVTVVTYADGETETPRGTTVNSFTSVSLDPPLILVSLGRQTRAAGNLPRRGFTVNVLRREQRDLALRFAGRPDVGGEPEWDVAGPAPALRGCAASFACSPWQVHEAGDHLLVLGRVERFETAECDPLIFFRGQFGALPANVSTAA